MATDDWRLSAVCNGNAKVTFISQNNNQTETETGDFRLEVLPVCCCFRCCCPVSGLKPKSFVQTPDPALAAERLFYVVCCTRIVAAFNLLKTIDFLLLACPGSAQIENDYQYVGALTGWVMNARKTNNKRKEKRETKQVCIWQSVSIMKYLVFCW